MISLPALAEKLGDLGTGTERRRLWWVPICSCLLIVLGVKFWLIESHGSPTPFWDQWDAEAATLYPQWLDGTLRMQDLVAPHAEHRIFFTRVMALGLLQLAGFWDTKLQMVASALVHAAAIGLLLVLLKRALRRQSVLMTAGFAALFIATPFGYENILSGFQSQFFFLLLFSLAALPCLLRSQVWGGIWWSGVALAAAAYLSMASGGVVLVAALSVASLQLSLGLRSGLREWAALVVYVVLFAVSCLLLPTIPGHDVLRPDSLTAFVHAVGMGGSWPLTRGALPTIGLILAAVVVHAPAILTGLRLIRERPGVSDRRWLLLSLWVWVVLQLLVIVSGRGMGILSSRYLDILVIGTIVNLACWLRLVDAAGVSHRVLVVAAALWVLLVVIGAGRFFSDITRPQLAWRKQIGLIETENLQRYLASGDVAVLQGKPLFHIPYPTVERLAEVLAIPTVRSILPPVLRGFPAEDTRQFERGAFIRTQTASLLKRGSLLVFIGFALLLSVAVGRLAEDASGGRPARTETEKI